MKKHDTTSLDINSIELKDQIKLKSIDAEEALEDQNHPKTIHLSKINNNANSNFISNLFDRTINWKFSFIILCICCFFWKLGHHWLGHSRIEHNWERVLFDKHSEWIFLGIFELAAFIASPIFGFLGSLERVNKLKLICLSLFAITFGSYIIGLTIFIKEPYLDFILNPDLFANQTNSNNDINLCMVNINHSKSADSLNCESVKRSMYFKKSKYDYSKQYELLLYLGHFIIGFGSVAIYSVGIAYIEEITPKHQSSYCQAILYGSGNFDLILNTFIYRN